MKHTFAQLVAVDMASYQIRLFFCHVLQATAKLRAAESATNPAEREALAREAVALLLKVPQCVNLDQIVMRLAYLKQYTVCGLHVYS